MKTLSEIKRNIISFYTTIQNKVTDFSVGSVINGIFYSVSASLEGVYSEVDEVKQQAYIATATGDYLDKLIAGSFQLERQPATRNVGYLVVYGNSPITSPDNINLTYATFDYSSGTFVSGLQTSTKFLGKSAVGDESVVYSLIQPRNASALNETLKRINLDGRNVQFLLLPVASVLTGSQVSVREGAINSFPSPPPGLSGVLNTNTPGTVFFSNSQLASSSPFYSRYTALTSYNTSTGSLGVVNAYNFSDTGFLEINHDSNDQPITATYTLGTEFRNAGIILEYVGATSTSISLKRPVVNSVNPPANVPYMKASSGGELITLYLTEFSYNGKTINASNVVSEGYTDLPHAIQGEILQAAVAPIINQRPDQITEDLIFDPDEVLTVDYELVSSARITGASDEASDSEYREALTKYLASLSRATRTAIEAGSLQVPGVVFARVLPTSLSPRGSSILIAANEDGTLSAGKKAELRAYLEDEWKAASINLIIKAPELVKVNTTVSVVINPGVSRASVSQQIRDSIDSYMKGKAPGDSLRYSDVLNIVVSIPSVSNAFNLILSRYLSDTTYSENKGAYDEAVLLHASGSDSIVQRGADAVSFSSSDLGKLVKINSPGTPDAIVTSGADGILYSFNTTTDYEVLLSSNPDKTSEVYYAITDSGVKTTEALKSAINNFQDGTTESSMFGATDEEYTYFLSYILAEVFSTGVVPIDPDEILYENIKDYTAKLTEVFRATSITLDIAAMPLIGIKYTTT